MRYKGKLTNCDTGDRFCVIRASTLKEPLPKFISFGIFTGRAFHKGQDIKSKPRKCNKCLQEGHFIGECKNDWVCTSCNTVGHKRGECIINEDVEITLTESHTEPQQTSTSNVSHTQQYSLTQEKEYETACSTQDEDEQTSKPTKKHKKKLQKDTGKTKTQTQIDTFVKIVGQNTKTPINAKRGACISRSPPTPSEILNDEAKKSRIHHDSADSSRL